MENEMIILIAAIVASYVAVVKKLKVIDNKYLPFVALALAAVFVLVPMAVRSVLIAISTIGLTASGVYSMTKNKVGDKG